MASPSPLLYLVLGTPGAGRRAVVRDLAENGLEPTERATVLVAEGEPESPADAALAALPRVTVRRWRWQAPGFPAPGADLGSHVFLLADPLVAVVDQVEALKPWLAEHGIELGRRRRRCCPGSMPASISATSSSSRAARGCITSG